MVDRDFIPRELEKALAQTVSALSFPQEDKQPVWLLGGSCGLMLQGVKLAAPPRDIDIYAELETSDKLHQALRPYADGGLEEDYSRDCFSLMGHYHMERYHLELVCGFRVSCGRSRYTVETSLLQAYAPALNLTGTREMLLMPLAHEFVFNVLRGRRDRYEAIAEVMKRNLQAHLPLLQLLLSRNSLESSRVWLIGELLGIPALCS